MASILEDVMWNREKLLWIDLSNNYLTTIDEDLAKEFPLLKTLYLHGNYMMDMQVITKFRELEHLQTLTLYGNPVEHLKNYRLIVLSVLYQTLNNLRKFDQVLVTRAEYDNVCAFSFLNSIKSLKTLKVPENAIKYPPVRASGDEDGRQSSQH